jgi:hypothetical protein
MSVAVPVARVRFQSRLVAVTLALPAGCVQFALQPWVTRWLPGNAKASVHPLIGSPRFVILTLAVNPPPQSLTL